MVELVNIRSYVEKMAYLLSRVLDMDVLICDDKLRIVGDFSHNGNVYKDDTIETLQEISVISKAIKGRKNIIYNNVKVECRDCIECVKKTQCRTESIIAFPLIRDNKLYGAIGIYSEEERQKNKITREEKVMLEFIENIGDLILTKVEEEEHKNSYILEKATELIRPMKIGSFNEIIGSSNLIQRVKEDAKSFAYSHSNILIQGESGTGKEVFTSAIHQESKCSNGPFVVVNCAAIPDNILESELFGYEEGSFTGALKGGRIGKFELANNGTIFLDEIGELPIHLQPKLLRAIQEKKIQRVGSSRYIDIKIRIISATNRNLKDMIQTGEFREDLYYRLSVIPIYLPPLRERKGDIPELLHYFLNMYKTMLDKNYITGFDNSAIEILSSYSWPGNIRELQNTVEYTVNKSKNIIIKTEDIPQHISQNSNSRASKPLTMQEVEKQAIVNALSYYNNTQEGKLKIANALGISRATLYRKLKEYNLL